MRGNLVNRRCMLAGTVATVLSTHTAAQSSPGSSSPASGPALAHTVEAVGYSELDGRPVFKLTIREHRGRWYLYTGHFWHRGWSVIDVTDPTKPEVVNFFPGPSNMFTGQIDLHGETMITSLEQGLTNAPWGLPMVPLRKG